MKAIFTSLFIFLTISIFAQTKTHRFNFALGGTIQHYNGK
jgi:hypothetical protein